MKSLFSRSVVCGLALSLMLTLVPVPALAVDEPQDVQAPIEETEVAEDSVVAAAPAASPEADATEGQEFDEWQADDGLEIPSSVEGESSEEAVDPTAISQDEQSEVTEEAPIAESIPDEPKEANGWRYQDGQPVAQESVEMGDVSTDEEGLAMKAMAGFVMWEKDSKGRYISSNGKPILGAVSRGVDVSEWNGTIDWDVAKNNDVSFAIIRVGGRYTSSRRIYDDDMFERNVSECERLGIPYGVYFFSAATTAKEAREEAAYTLEQLKGHHPSLPIYYDLEWEELASTQYRSTLATISKEFCGAIERAGYEAGVYASVSWWENYLTDSCFEQWPRWVAQYYSRCEYEGSYHMWQCTGAGSIKGFEESSSGVDINFYFGEEAWSNPVESKVWTRLWGNNAFDTMTAIVQGGWADNSCKNVVVATSEGYWDALSASALAGSLGCPVLITPKDSLSSKTAAEIQRLGATTAYVIGGPAALSYDIDSQLKAAGVTPVRVWGQNAAGTAREVAKRLGSAHSKTCFVATSNGYWDALSASPISYVKGMPIFLTEGSENTLSQETLEAIKSGGYTEVVVTGGPIAVPTAVDGQIRDIGVKVTRKYGDTAHETSVAVADYGLSLGLKTSNMGVATSKGYWDALTGAALCGKRGSVLVLVGDGNRVAIDSFVAKHANEVTSGVVFGGQIAVSVPLWNALVGVTQ